MVAHSCSRGDNVYWLGSHFLPSAFPKLNFCTLSLACLLWNKLTQVNILSRSILSTNLLWRRVNIEFHKISLIFVSSSRAPMSSLVSTPNGEHLKLEIYFPKWNFRFVCILKLNIYQGEPSSRVSGRRTGEEPHIGKYRLLKTIGKGNFAKVKLAKHIPTGKEVAIKIIDKTQVYLKKIKISKEMQIFEITIKQLLLSSWIRAAFRNCSAKCGSWKLWTIQT